VGGSIHRVKRAPDLGSIGTLPRWYQDKISNRVKIPEIEGCMLLFGISMISANRRPPRRHLNPRQKFFLLLNYLVLI
jgi:hypothetical protein